MPKLNPKLKHKKEWLSSYNIVKLEAQSILDEIEYIETTTERLITTLSLTPKGKKGDKQDQWIKAIEKKDELVHELMIQYRKLMRYLKRIEEAIEQIRHPKERLILRLHYINGQQFSTCMKDKGIRGFTERQVFRWHAQGLEHLDIPAGDKRKVKEWIDE